MNYIGDILYISFVKDEWAAAQQKQQNDLCTQWRLRLAWASAQSDQILSHRRPDEETLLKSL